MTRMIFGTLMKVWNRRKNKIILLGLFLMGYFIASSIITTNSIDWDETFYAIAGNPLAPYAASSHFVNPPWAVLTVFWAGWFSLEQSYFLQTGLMFLFTGWMILNRVGEKSAVIPILLTFTSFPFVLNMYMGNIDWVIAIGFILGNGWGLPFLLVKPQAGLFAAIAWWKRANNKFHFFIPALVVIFGSFALWGNWMNGFIENLEYVRGLGMDGWNAARFPYFVPLGIALLIHIFRQNGEDATLEGAGVIATLCFTPYFGWHGLLIPFALLAAKRPDFAALLWLPLWSLHYR